MVGDKVMEADVLQVIRDEAQRLEDELLFYHAGHNEEARVWDNWHQWLGGLTALLAALAGVTSFSSAGIRDSAGLWSSVAAGTLAFGGAAMAGLNAFLDPKKRAAEHYRAATAYAAIRDDARYLHRIECKKGKTAEELDAMFVELRQRLFKLEEQTPIICAKLMARAAAKIKAGEYTYALDHTAGKQALGAGVALDSPA